jgi:hypothetical protein
VEELAVAVATDYKQLRVWLTGTSSGTLASLQTTDKSSIIGAINEARTTGGSGTPPDATETVKGVLELATLAEVATGTDASRAVTAAGVRQERDALKAEILGGVGPAFDTLSELLAVAQGAEESSVIADLTTVVGNKANASDVYTKTEIGDPDTDFAAVYAAAKA